jgi:hypothetical protein
LAEAPSDSGIFLIISAGGPERKISSSTCVASSVPILSWSAGGKQLAFLHHPEGSASNDAIGLFVLSLASLEEKDPQLCAPGISLSSGAAHFFGELSPK